MIARCYQLVVVLLLLLVCACSSLPPGADFPKTVSTAIADPIHTALGKHFMQAAHEHPNQSGFRLISGGTDGFLIRMQMIASAQRSIDLQNYVFRDDVTGRLLSSAVLQAADRGVQLRILIDDAEIDTGDQQIAALKAHPNIEVRVFNPFSYRGQLAFLRGAEVLVNANRLDYRMHNKLLIIDNAVSLIGARNIGDQYLQINPNPQFADDDVLAAGPISQKLSDTFDQFWNAPLSIPVEALDSSSHPEAALQQLRQELKDQHNSLAADGDEYITRIVSGEPFNSILAGRLVMVWATVQLLVETPDKKNGEGRIVSHLFEHDVTNAVAASQSELLLLTPVLAPSAEDLRILKELRQRHVRIRILTNSLESPTESSAQAGAMGFRKNLLDAGVELFESRALQGDSKARGETQTILLNENYSTHKKLLVMDRSRLYIGSMNVDQHSGHLDTEIGLVIDSPDLAQQVAARFDAMVQPVNAYRLSWDAEHRNLIWVSQEKNQTVTYGSDPENSTWQRLKTDFWSFLPINRQ